MKYLKFTHVDARTGTPCTEAPMIHGPAMPLVYGLVFAMAAESEYPTQTPTFYGTAPDASDTDLPGVLAVLSEDEYTLALAGEMTARRSKMVIAPRQARLALLGAGMLDYVEPAIAATADEQQRRAAQISWEFATTVERNSPWVASMAGALGLTDEQLDELFVAAAGL